MSAARKSDMAMRMAVSAHLPTELSGQFDRWIADVFSRNAARALLREAPQGWVSVSDTDAPIGRAVLFATEFDGPGDWRIKAGFRDQDRGYVIWGASWTPSHWQPLAAPPAATEEKP